MKAQYLFPGFIWLHDKVMGRKAYLLKLDKEIKNRFSYVQNKKNKQIGYSRNEFNTGNSLALYICRYLGDGIYYCDAPEVLKMFIGADNASVRNIDIVYLLIVVDGKVLPGTDIIVKRELFNFFIEDIASTEYSDLSVRVFTIDDFCELNKKYISDEVSKDKYSKYMLGLVLIVSIIVCGGGLAWFILLA